MSNSSQSSSNSIMSSSDSDCSEESSCYLTANSGGSEPEFSPFDDTIEPLALVEEIAQYEDSIAREEELENTLQARFEGRVNVFSWCECGNCNLALVVNSMECHCCMQIEQCRQKMWEYEHENNRKCLIDHPGFTNVCLNKFVLNTASLGLKTKSHRSYASVYHEGQRTQSEFFRAVSYRQLVRFVWDFTGSSRHLPLPCCSYNKIRSTFPNEKMKEYTGFEEDEDI